MVTLTVPPLWRQPRVWAVGLGVLVAVLVSALVVPVRDRLKAERCRALYAQARTGADTAAIDAGRFTDSRGDAATGLRCGLLRARGDVR